MTRATPTGFWLRGNSHQDRNKPPILFLRWLTARRPRAELRSEQWVRHRAGAGEASRSRSIWDCDPLRTGLATLPRTIDDGARTDPMIVQPVEGEG